MKNEITFRACGEEFSDDDTVSICAAFYDSFAEEKYKEPIAVVCKELSIEAQTSNKLALGVAKLDQSQLFHLIKLGRRSAFKSQIWCKRIANPTHPPECSIIETGEIDLTWADDFLSRWRTEVGQIKRTTAINYLVAAASALLDTLRDENGIVNENSDDVAQEIYQATDFLITAAQSASEAEGKFAEKADIQVAAVANVPE